MLVNHYMKKSTQIISNEDYMGIIDLNNEILRKSDSFSHENDDDVRRRIFEENFKLSSSNRGIISFNKDGDQKLVRSTTIIKTAEFKENDNNINGYHTQDSENINNGNENPFITKFKNHTIHNKKNVITTC